MVIRKALLTGFLLLLLSMLTLALHLYSFRQQALTLEGNNILSVNSFQVDGIAVDVLGSLSGDASDVRIFKQLTDDGNIRAIMALKYSEVAIPIHAGEQFDRETHTALVGSRVTLKQQGAHLYYSFDGQDYKVVGYLGLNADSLLSNDVLINDPNLFSLSTSEPLTVDGEGALKAFMKNNPGQAIPMLQQDSNRRTNIDFVSPMLIIFGACISLLGVVATGILTFRAYEPYLRVRNLLGSTRRCLFTLLLGQVSTIWLVTFLMAYCLCLFYTSDLSLFAVRLFAGIQYLILMATLSMLFLWSRRRTSWN